MADEVPEMTRDERIGLLVACGFTSQDATILVDQEDAAGWDEEYLDLPQARS